MLHEMLEDFTLVLSIAAVCIWLFIGARCVHFYARANGGRPFISLALFLIPLMLLMSALFTYSSVRNFTQSLSTQALVIACSYRILNISVAFVYWRSFQKVTNLIEIAHSKKTLGGK